MRRRLSGATCSRGKAASAVRRTSRDSCAANSFAARQARCRVDPRQLGERLAPIAVGAAIADKSPDRDDGGDEQHDNGDPRSPGLRPQADLAAAAECRSGPATGSSAWVTPSSRRSAKGRLRLRCVRRRGHGVAGTAPSRRRSCGAVSSAALSGSTGTPSSRVQANTPFSRASVACMMLWRTLSRPTSSWICSSPSVTVIAAEAGRSLCRGSCTRQRDDIIVPRHARRSSSASHRPRRRNR